MWPVEQTAGFFSLFFLSVPKCSSNFGWIFFYLKLDTWPMMDVLTWQRNLEWPKNESRKTTKAVSIVSETTEVMHQAKGAGSDRCPAAMVPGWNPTVPIATAWFCHPVIISFCLFSKPWFLASKQRCSVQFGLRIVVLKWVTELLFWIVKYYTV